MNSWKVILATMVIFGTGVLTGGLLVKHTATPSRNRAPKNAIAGTNASPPNIAPAQLQRMEFLLRVRSELNLTPEQHERIEQIIRDGQEKSRKLWETVAPDLRKELQTVHEKIRATLTPEQRPRFEELLKRAPRPNANNPEGNQPLPADRLRERLRQGNPGEPPFNPNSPPRPPRRENLPPPGNPPPDNPLPAPGEPR